MVNLSRRDLYPLKDDVILIHYGEILRQLVIARGGDSSALLEGTGIRPSFLANAEGFLSYAQFSRLVHNAIELTQDPSLGLHFGRCLNPMTHGILGQAILSAADIQQALEILTKYFRTRIAAIRISFFVDGKEAVVQLDEVAELGELKIFLIEAVLVSVIEIGRCFFGQRVTVGGRCLFNYHRPAYDERYPEFSFENAEFSQPHTQLRFPARFLKLPMALANPVARELAERQCEAFLREQESKQTVVAKVQSMLELSEDELPDMEEIAARLCVTSRTLRRQLKTYNTSYQEILAEVRCRQALRLLQYSNKSVDEIAQRLGYTDPSNFGRAFRKWTGRAPGDVRRG